MPSRRGSSIGELDFAAGGNGQYVRVDDNTGEAESTETKIVFDALRFTRVADGPADEPGEDNAPSAGGCSTGHVSSLWLLVAVILVRRRRAENSGRDR